VKLSDDVHNLFVETINLSDAICHRH
jgi:hypothetical protein